MSKSHDKLLAFTLIELLVVLSIISLLLSILIPTLSRARKSAVVLRDATKIRTVHQTWIAWSAGDQGRFPTPGLVDRLPDPSLGLDVSGRGPEDGLANSTDNVHSVSVMQNLYTTDAIVSDMEPNAYVFVLDNYDYDIYDPSSTVDTYWDESLECKLDESCNVSYASIPVFGSRKPVQWKNSGFSDFAVLSNRGPKFGNSDIQSRTFEIHGEGRSWKGNVCWQDNHVTLEETLFPENSIYRTSAGQTMDNLFNIDCVSGVCNFYGGDIWLVLATNFTGDPVTPNVTLEWDDE